MAIFDNNGAIDISYIAITRVRDNLKWSLREGLLRKPSLKDQK